MISKWTCVACCPANFNSKHTYRCAWIHAHTHTHKTRWANVMHTYIQSCRLRHARGPTTVLHASWCLRRFLDAAASPARSANHGSLQATRKLSCWATATSRTRRRSLCNISSPLGFALDSRRGTAATTVSPTRALSVSLGLGWSMCLPIRSRPPPPHCFLRPPSVAGHTPPSVTSVSAPRPPLMVRPLATAEALEARSTSDSVAASPGLSDPPDAALAAWCRRAEAVVSFLLACSVGASSRLSRDRRTCGAPPMAPARAVSCATPRPRKSLPTKCSASLVPYHPSLWGHPYRRLRSSCHARFLRDFGSDLSLRHVFGVVDAAVSRRLADARHDRIRAWTERVAATAPIGAPPSAWSAIRPSCPASSADLRAAWGPV